MKSWSKLLCIFVASFLCCGVALGQNTTTLTGTVTDADSQVWAFAKWQATIVVPGGGKAVFTDGTPVPAYSGVLTSGGVFPGGAVVGNTTKILPFGATWSYTVCTVTSAPCGNFQQATQGSSFDMGTFISTHLNPPRVQASNLAYAYNSTEVLNPINGTGYTNTISNSIFCWVSTAYVSCGGSGGGGGVTSINGTPGAFTFTGSVTCVGTSCAFGSLASTTYILISQLGCAAQNSNLNSGGGTDDTACINTALALATATHPVVLIQDGVSLVHGILGPAAGNWGIIGLGGGFISPTAGLYGTGFYLANGSTASTISNTTFCGDPGTTPPNRSANLIFQNFAVNGNAANNPTYCYGIDIANINGINISGVTIYNQSHYMIRLDNSGNAVIHGDSLIGSGLVNQDSLHIDGPASNITISDILMNGGDDGIALNSSEGYCGPITNVSATNVIGISVLSLARMYTGSIVCTNGLTAGVSKVNFVNVSGTAIYHAAIFGGVPGFITGFPQVQQSITDVKWSDSQISSPFGFEMGDTFGSIEFDNIKWSNPSCYAVTPFGTITQPNCGFVEAWQHNGLGGPLQGGNLTINNSSILRTPAGNLGLWAVDGQYCSEGANCTSIAYSGQLTISGFANLSQGGSYAQVPELLNTKTINTNATINGIDPVGYGVIDSTGGQFDNIFAGLTGALNSFAPGQPAFIAGNTQCDDCSLFYLSTIGGGGFSENATTSIQDASGNQQLQYGFGNMFSKVGGQTTFQNKDFFLSRFGSPICITTSLTQCDYLHTTTGITFNLPVTLANGCTGCSGLPSQVATIAVTGATTAVCKTGHTCTSNGGTITTVATTAGASSLFTVSWPVGLSTNSTCAIIQEGDPSAFNTWVGLYGSATASGATSFAVATPVTLGGTTLEVTYTCIPQ